MMSQSDNSLFHIVIRSLFLFSGFGFSACLVHSYYQNVSGNKIHYNYLEKIVALKLKMDAYHHRSYPKHYKLKVQSKS
jgi:hypothetical protein